MEHLSRSKICISGDILDSNGSCFQQLITLCRYLCWNLSSSLHGCSFCPAFKMLVWLTCVCCSFWRAALAVQFLWLSVAEISAAEGIFPSGFWWGLVRVSSSPRLWSCTGLSPGCSEGHRRAPAFQRHVSWIARLSPSWYFPTSW